MATDYSKKKNADLEALLKERNLPHTGKKAELIARLQADDGANPAPTTTPAAAPPEDDKIDWDDEAAPVSTEAGPKGEASKTTSDPASGVFQVPNPTAVPNQIVDEETEPADVNVLGAKQNIDPAAAVITAPAPTEDEAEKKAAEPEKPKVDFTRGLAASSADTEAEKRRKRAERFGIKPEEKADDAKDEGKAKAERAKRFGTDGTAEKGEKAVGALDRALPERQERPAKGEKRGRDLKDEGRKEGGKRVDSRRRDGRNGGGGGGAGKKDASGKQGDERKANKEGTSKPTPTPKKEVGESDKAAAEKRKARFGAAPSASTEKPAATATAS